MPALRLEAYAFDEAQLKKRLEDAVYQEFSQRKRLHTVQDIVSAIWFDSIELLQQEIQLEAPSLTELEQLEYKNQEKWLPRVAKQLDVRLPAAYGREGELQQFARALKGRYTRNVLLVYERNRQNYFGMGTYRRQRKRRTKDQIWETSASTLIKELIQDTGWEENLSMLCKELSGSGQILFVRNLMELFEVGKYEGNAVSMAY
ncbi:MAG: hypothetical protein H6564_18250 [Lewinellaceae bacterium]|nr:hypothetical protein [Lewinellaceae bacterium]